MRILNTFPPLFHRNLRFTIPNEASVYSKKYNILNLNKFELPKKLHHSQLTLN